MLSHYEIVEVKVEEELPWIQEKALDLIEFIGSVTQAIPGPRVGPTSLPWILAVPLGYAALTFVIAFLKTVRNFASPKAQRRKLVGKNALLCKSVDELLQRGRDEVKVKLNGTAILFKSFRDYADLFLKCAEKSKPMPLPRIRAKMGDRWEICVSLSDGQASFGSKCDVPESMLKDVEKSGIVDTLLSWADFKQSKDLKKTDGTTTHPLHYCSNNNNTSFPFDEIVEVKVEEELPWIQEKALDLIEFTGSVTQAIPGPRVGPTSLPWILVVPLGYAALTFVIAFLKTVRNFASPKAQRRKLVGKNALLCKSVDELLQRGRDEVKVKLNGTAIRFKSFRDYADLFLKCAEKSKPMPLPRIRAKMGDRWEICVSLSDGQASFGSKCDVPESMLKDVEKSGIVDTLLSWADFKQSKDLKKTDGTTTHPLHYCSNNNNTSFPFDEIVEVKVEEELPWIQEKALDLIEFTGSVTQAIPGPRVGPTSLPWILVVPLGYAALTFVIAFLKTVRNFASPKARRRKLVGKNALLCKSVDELLQRGRDEVKVKLNGTAIRFKSFRDYADLFLKCAEKSKPMPLPRIRAKMGDRWEICVSLSDG
ncbi:hypothetical protein RYX36_007937 [Vicia faba]